MQIDTEFRDGVALLGLKGKITLGESDEILKETINRLLLQGTTRIVLDLSDVPYIDSAGLGELVRSFTAVSRVGCHLVLVGLTKRVQDLLSITKLMTVFETYETADQAVAAFRT